MVFMTLTWRLDYYFVLCPNLTRVNRVGMLYIGCHVLTGGFNMWPNCSYFGMTAFSDELCTLSLYELWSYMNFVL